MDPDTPEKRKARRALTIIYVVMIIFVFAPLLVYLFVEQARS